MVEIRGGSLRPQVSEDEAVALDDVAGRACDRDPEDWPVVDEGVELAVFPTGVDVGREFGEQALVVSTPGKGCTERARVDADDDGLEPEREEVAGELCRVTAPEWKEPVFAGGGKALLAVGAHVLEKEVAKGDLGDRAQ